MDGGHSFVVRGSLLVVGGQWAGGSWQVGSGQWSASKITEIANCKSKVANQKQNEQAFSCLLVLVLSPPVRRGWSYYRYLA